jgi:hypothetical protein
MYKSLDKDISMLQFKERQAKAQKHSFSNAFSRYSKKLITGAIITSLTISSVLPSSAWAKSKKAAKEQTYALATDGKSENQVVSAEKTIFVNENKYPIKLETNDNWTEIKTYSDNSYFDSFNISKFINENFSGKFEDREIIMGNPSFMVKGIDGNGNYAYLLFNNIQGNVHATPINSGFNAEILKKLEVEVKCIFNEGNREWRVSYQKDGNELEYGIYSEDGKKFKAESLCNYQLEKDHDSLKEKPKE